MGTSLLSVFDHLLLTAGIQLIYDCGAWCLSYHEKLVSPLVGPLVVIVLQMILDLGANFLISSEWFVNETVQCCDLSAIIFTFQLLLYQRVRMVHTLHRSY